MIEQIQEIGSLIAPRIFGKQYSQLRYESSMGKLKQSELFECCAIAQTIRLEAMTAAANKGRDPTTLSMHELLDLCDEVLERPDAIERQKSELRRRGFLGSETASPRDPQTEAENRSDSQ
jgi:hypothetical protein